MKLMQDPRFMKVMQDERVMKAVMRGFQLKQQAQEKIDSQVESIAKQLNLATKSEVRELKRALRKMEQELEKERAKSKSEK
jgi:polyhydroxyalkanoate synthesis regulator phasin